MARAPRSRDLFGRPGYVRVPNPEKQATAGRKYRKGWEVRLVAGDPEEADNIAALARRLGYKPGRTFPKHSRFIVPIYGQDAVDSFVRERNALASVRTNLKRPVSAPVRAEIHDLID